MKENRCVGKKEVLKEHDYRNYTASINLLVIR